MAAIATTLTTHLRAAFSTMSRRFSSARSGSSTIPLHARLFQGIGDPAHDLAEQRVGKPPHRSGIPAMATIATTALAAKTNASRA